MNSVLFLRFKNIHLLALFKKMFLVPPNLGCCLLYYYWLSGYQEELFSPGVDYSPYSSDKKVNELSQGVNYCQNSLDQKKANFYFVV